jgi:hypothetical protein
MLNVKLPNHYENKQSHLLKKSLQNLLILNVKLPNHYENEQSHLLKNNKISS